jgi:hypothetical protein
LTFKPQINRVSYAITSNEERTSKPLWDRLIEHDKKVKEIMDQKFIFKKVSEQQKELSGCTFEPRLNTQRYRQKEELQGDVYDRNSMWKLHKDMKVDEQRMR